jgi:hypothetical protein
MMSYRLLKIFTLSSACIFSLACTSISSPPTTIATQGTVKITFSLPQHARAEFQLFDGKPGKINSPLVRVIFNDENCTSGHLGSINYKKSYSEYLFQYFENEAAWNYTNTLILSWDTNNRITTTLNNEVIHSDIYNDVNRLKIASHLAPIKIQTFEYLSQ